MSYPLHVISALKRIGIFYVIWYVRKICHDKLLCNMQHNDYTFHDLGIIIYRFGIYCFPCFGFFHKLHVIPKVREEPENIHHAFAPDGSPPVEASHTVSRSVPKDHVPHASVPSSVDVQWSKDPCSIYLK